RPARSARRAPTATTPRGAGRRWRAKRRARCARRARPRRCRSSRPAVRARRATRTASRRAPPRAAARRRACVATRRAATGGAPGDRAAPPSADAEARDTAATSPWSARAPPLLPCVRGAEAERVERRHDLVFHHLADDLLLRGGVEHSERARRSFTAGRRVAAAREAALDVDDDAGRAIGDALTLGARPLRRAPRQVIPA